MVPTTTTPKEVRAAELYWDAPVASLTRPQIAEAVIYLAVMTLQVKAQTNISGPLSP